jgi:hypothetical protein
VYIEHLECLECLGPWNEKEKGLKSLELEEGHYVIDLECDTKTKYIVRRDRFTPFNELTLKCPYPPHQNEKKVKCMYNAFSVKRLTQILQKDLKDFHIYKTRYFTTKEMNELYTKYFYNTTLNTFGFSLSNTRFFHNTIIDITSDEIDIHQKISHRNRRINRRRKILFLIASCMSQFFLSFSNECPECSFGERTFFSGFWMCDCCGNIQNYGKDLLEDDYLFDINVFLIVMNILCPPYQFDEDSLKILKELVGDDALVEKRF